MINPHPNDPLAYQEWVNQLEQNWQAGLIPDPQAVAVIVLNDQGEILLQLHDSNPNISFANFWTLPGGAVEANETTEEAARRELQEELPRLSIAYDFDKLLDEFFEHSKGTG